MGDASSNNDIDNNFTNRNTHATTGFSTYNVTSTNANADASAVADNTSGIKDVGSISGAKNNIDSKNAHAKADFSTYNIAGANASDMCGTGKKVSNNTNNIGAN